MKNKYMKINYAGILLLGLTLACHSATEKNTTGKVQGDTVLREETKKVPEDKLVVAGKQAGLVFLGEDMKAVFDLLGKADDGDAAMGSALAIWYTKDKADTGRKESVIIFSSYRDSNMVVKDVKQIAVTSPAFNTADHMHTGVTLLQLLAVYPSVKMVSSYINEKTGDSLHVFDDMASGIAFDVQKNQCSAIIVHAKNKSVNGAYLSIHPGWKKVQ